MRFEKSLVVLVAVGLLVGGCSSSNASDESNEEELAAGTVVDATTTSVPPTTTSVPPTTTEAPTTTVAPTTTTKPSTTTTTVNVTFAVSNQMYILGDIQLGNPDVEPIRNFLIEVAEAAVGSMGRVDVVTAEVSNAVGIRVIVEADSGFRTTENQQDAAAAMVSLFAINLWVPDWFGNILDSGEGGVDFDLTMDGRNWVIPAQTMIDISNRRASPASALGL